MIVLGSGLVLTDGSRVNGNNPVIGYHNLVALGNVTAESADDDHPATELANPNTSLYWLANDTTEHHLTVDVTAYDDVIDYVAVAKHNFGTAGIAVSVEGNSGAGWSELVAAVIPADDSPILFRFTPATLNSIRLRLQTGTEAARAAVMYTGKLLVVQRRVYVGHSPLNLARNTRITNGRSESGNFLGRIVTGESASGSVSLQNLTAGWYRTYFDPFVVASRDTPFFFGWRPSDYPLEVGFVWCTADPIPSNQLSNGMMQVDLSYTGIVT